MQFKLKLIGTSAMLQHNGRLANPIDPYTRELKKITGRRKKTDEDLIRVMQIESRGACYEDADGFLGLPALSVYRSIVEACRFDKLGKHAERGLSCADIVERLTLADGTQRHCDDFLSDPANIDYRGTKVGKSRVMRSRPIIAAGWSGVFTFSLNTEVLDLDALMTPIERAGALVGVGDYRPRFGQFRAEVVS